MCIKPVRKERADEVLGGCADLDVIGKGKRIFVVHDFAVSAYEGFGVKGRVADEHFVEKDADGPPVALAAVKAFTTLRFEHLWRDVVRRPDSRVRSHQAILLVTILLGKTEMQMGKSRLFTSSIFIQVPKSASLR